MDLMELKMKLIDQKNTDHKTAILAGPDDLLRQAVELLILDAKDWDVIGIWDEFEVDELIRDVDGKNPDVVVINRGGLTDKMDLPLQLMKGHADITIITIGLEDNLMDVYNRQKVSISGASDLLLIINQCADKFKTGREVEG
jgi:hypothetical protein